MAASVEQTVPSVSSSTLPQHLNGRHPAGAQGLSPRRPEMRKAFQPANCRGTEGVFSYAAGLRFAKARGAPSPQGGTG